MKLNSIVQVLGAICVSSSFFLSETNAFAALHGHTATGSHVHNVHNNQQMMVVAFTTPKSSIVTRTTTSTTTTTTQLQMKGDFGSDFASAMPEKPKLTVKEQMQESATAFLLSFEGQLKKGVNPPPQVDALRQARDSNADIDILAACIYELLIEQGMLYDQDPEDGTLSLTNFDIQNNLEIKEVKDEFSYLYKYGMSLCAKGILSVDTVKQIVTERLIARTGLTPEEFDSWLGY
jgi:hypothetical protein